MKTEAAGVSLHLQDGCLHITARGGSWSWPRGWQPRIVTDKGEEIPFSRAGSIVHSPYESGAGRGIRSAYGDFPGTALSFETLVWIEYSTGDVYFEFIPLCEDFTPGAVYWPGPMDFRRADPEWYTVLNLLQGLLVPNTWQTETGKLPFDGQLCSCASYMPWFGQVRPGAGYLALCQTPWDAAYQVDHPAGGPYTEVSFRWLPSLGRIRSRRILRYTFFGSCDYNDLCKCYRDYARETGLLTTLREKAARNPLVDKLIGSVVVHKGIKNHTSPDSLFYDPDHPEKNDSLVTFARREQEIRHYREKGIRKLYLHLDGWAEPGYDNQHPDYLPACQAAGGWEGLKALSDAMEECGYMLGLHDQYRDYYFDAPSFDRQFACQAPDGSILDVARWAGGRQSDLCASQAPYYVKRNFEEILSHGIHLEASYLDVFTCNEGDECADPHHRMTRRECFQYREQCFRYLMSRGILPSSEEVTDWAMNSLVFSHYGPYDFQLQKPGQPRRGIPVPLFNLVYHDCMVLPWMMDRLPGQEDYMLYALLNGGAAYLDRGAAYPGCDGAFSDAEAKLEEDMARCAVVAELQERVAKQELLRHEFLEGDPLRQRTVFADGTAVTVDLGRGTYEICTP